MFSLLLTITYAQVFILTSEMAESFVCSQNYSSLHTIESTGMGTQTGKENPKTLCLVNM